MCVGECSCPTSGAICIPRGDAQLVVVDVREGRCDGDLFDISGVSEITFAVSDTVGGVVRIVKRLSTGGISVSTNGYQFYFTITSEDSDSIVMNSNYFEIRAVTASGSPKTIISGLFKSPQTNIKDLQ